MTHSDPCGFHYFAHEGYYNYQINTILNSLIYIYTYIYTYEYR